MLFIVKKTPHFIHFDANCDVFMLFKIIFVHILYLLFFFFNSFMTVSVLPQRPRRCTDSGPVGRPFDYGFLYIGLAAVTAVFRVKCLMGTG
jgi:hypothetical protein